LRERLGAGRRRGERNQAGAGGIVAGAIAEAGLQLFEADDIGAAGLPYGSTGSVRQPGAMAGAENYNSFGSSSPAIPRRAQSTIPEYGVSSGLISITFAPLCRA
jgi:hypothetical protein